MYRMSTALQAFKQTTFIERLRRRARKDSSWQLLWIAHQNALFTAKSIHRRHSISSSSMKRIKNQIEKTAHKSNQIYRDSCSIYRIFRGTASILVDTSLFFCSQHADTYMAQKEDWPKWSSNTNTKRTNCFQDLTSLAYTICCFYRGLVHHQIG